MVSRATLLKSTAALVALIISAQGIGLSRTNVAPGSHAQASESKGCGSGIYASEFPIGGVIVNETDKPGPSGNEISNIFAVADSSETLIGWLYTSFDRNVMFEPIRAENGRTFRIAVPFPALRSFDVKPWLMKSALMANSLSGQFSLSPIIKGELGKRSVMAHLVPCFKQEWSG